MASEAAQRRAVLARQAVALGSTQVAAESELAAAAEADSYRVRVDETKKRAVMEAPTYDQFHQRVLATDLVPLAGKQIQGELLGGQRPAGSQETSAGDTQLSGISPADGAFLLDLTLPKSERGGASGSGLRSWTQLAAASAANDADRLLSGTWADGMPRLGRRRGVAASRDARRPPAPVYTPSTHERLSLSAIAAEALRPCGGVQGAVAAGGDSGAAGEGVVAAASSVTSASAAARSTQGPGTSAGKSKSKGKAKGGKKGASSLPRTLMQLERDWRRESRAATGQGQGYGLGARDGRVTLMRGLGPRRLARLTGLEVDAGLLGDVLQLAERYGPSQGTGELHAAGGAGEMQKTDSRAEAQAQTRWDREALGWVEAVMVDRTPREQSRLPWAKGYVAPGGDGAGVADPGAMIGTARQLRISGPARLAWTLVRAEAREACKAFLGRCVGYGAGAEDVSARARQLQEALLG